MIWSSVKSIRSVQIEISSLCQAGCIDCNRWRPQGGYAEWDLNTHADWVLNGDHHWFNAYYDHHQFDQHISQFTDLDHLQFCGNVGDPMTHPHIADCCESVFVHLPHCAVDISTNGAVGTDAQWIRLAKLSVNQPLTVTFAIDGLADTNHIYRRAVKWSDLEHRVRTYIDQGGRAQWKWIKFPHNSHQIDTARQLADEWGFDSFEVGERFTQTDQFDQEIIYQSSQPVQRSRYHQEPVYDDHLLAESHRQQLAEYNQRAITVDAGCMIQHQPGSFYHPCPHLNVDGTVWPCCYTANGNYHAAPHIRQQWRKWDNEYGQGWNSLHQHSLETIIQHPFFQQDLAESWSHNLICLEHCGKCIN